MVIKKGRFVVDIYKVSIHIIICDTEESVAIEGSKLTKRYKEDSIDDPCFGLCFAPDLKAGTYYLLLAANGLTVNTITHETDHLRNYIIDFCSLAEYTDSKEASANLNGFLNEKVFKFLIKNKIEIKY